MAARPRGTIQSRTKFSNRLANPFPDERDSDPIRSCDSPTIAVKQGGILDGLTWLDVLEAFSDRHNQSGTVAARTDDKMHRVIGELLSTVFVWFALIGNAVIRGDDTDPGFEPRDSMVAKKRVIEYLKFDPTEPTEVAPEVMRTVEPSFALLCDTCPECEACKKSPGEIISVPDRFLGKPEFIIAFSSNDTSDIEKGMERLFSDRLMDKLLWSVGLKPLRVWHKECALVTSMFSGELSVCNCMPVPDDFQFLMGGLAHLFHSGDKRVECDSNGGVCTIDVGDSEAMLWFAYDSKTEPLLQKRAGSFHNVTMPRFELHIHGQYVNPDKEDHNGTKSEFFYAFNRTELRALAQSALQRLVDDHKVFKDVGRIIHTKIDGLKPRCLKVGDKTPIFYTLDRFMRIDKLR